MCCVEEEWLSRYCINQSMNDGNKTYEKSLQSLWIQMTLLKQTRKLVWVQRSGIDTIKYHT